jgi:hypothetical protein
MLPTEQRRELKTFKTSWGGSVSIVSEYRLDDRSSIPAMARGFFL